MTITIGFDAKRAMNGRTGLGNYSRFIIQSVAESPEVEDIVLFSPKSSPNGPLQPILDKYGDLISVKTARGKCSKSWWRTFGITSELKNIDIYHGLSNELPLNIRRAEKCRSIVTIHDTIWRTLPHTYPLIDRTLYEFKYGRSCRNADHIIAVSECTKRDIIRFYGISPEKISVVYQGFDASFSKKASETEKNEVREKYSLPSDFILSVGTIQERKNMAVLAQSLRFLPRDIHLVLVGKSTSYTKQVESAAREAGTSDRIHIIHGIYSTDLPVIYQCASVFSLPSRYEGFGIPIIEALASGIPVIAATGSCLEEAGGPDSLYVHPDNAEGFADAILKARGKEQREKMAASGYKWIERFSPTTIGESLLKCYRRVLESQ